MQCMIDFSHRKNSLFCLFATYTTVLVNAMSVAVAVLHESDTAMKNVETQLTTYNLTTYTFAITRLTNNKTSFLISQYGSGCKVL